MMKTIAVGVVSLVFGLGAVAWAVQGQTQADAAQAARDQRLIAVQAICPVSGEPLDARVPPVKAKAGEESVFLCCEECRGSKVDAKHWRTIHANYAAAQRICPVMRRPLPAQPRSTVAAGRVVYVCCPPCSRKIAADPQRYLQEVDKQYAASLEARQAGP